MSVNGFIKRMSFVLPLLLSTLTAFAQDDCLQCEQWVDMEEEYIPRLQQKPANKVHQFSLYEEKHDDMEDEPMLNAAEDDQ